VRFEYACRKFGASPALKIEGPKITYFRRFSTTSQLNGNFNGQYLRSETWYRQSGTSMGNYKGSPARLKISWTLVHKRLKIGPEFLPILRKFCILFQCQASHTEVSKPNTTKLCETMYILLSNHANYSQWILLTRLRKDYALQSNKLAWAHSDFLFNYSLVFMQCYQSFVKRLLTHF